MPLRHFKRCARCDSSDLRRSHKSNLLDNRNEQPVNRLAARFFSSWSMRSGLLLFLDQQQAFRARAEKDGPSLCRQSIQKALIAARRRAISRSRNKGSGKFPAFAI
jgi:hypothetical protein